MADGDALRSRRKRAHAAGDHSLCVRCAVKRTAVSRPGRPAPVSDAEAELRQIAAELAEDYRRDRGNALLARELRMTLQALLPARGGPSLDGELEELFAELRA